ncbi:DUF6508 domain-containing protein [Acidiphilium sp. PA]|uniref:DUF6508 domain-containing protein n=1 Tax=Acidiphilium sp. PA TaxID=2871705 RepID=UPI002243DFAA|nr:DUF6508 domain-containing protein [Acidiphilium sp. PA]MCW8308865.1 DUF6508 domain-containing protein [Acidiphilium sp. PA]
MTETIGPFNAQQLNALAQFLPEFEAPNFGPGMMSPMSPNADGSVSFPYAALSDKAGAFVTAAYENGWVVGHFDWPAWSSTAVARRLRSDESAIAEATLEELARLLTVLIRQERFAEGTLLDAFKAGLILRIIRRIDTLAQAGREGLYGHGNNERN